MNDSTTKKSEKPRLHIIFGVGLGEYTAATLVGLASGLTGALTAVHARFNDDLKKSSLMKELVESHANDLDESAKRFHENYRPIAANESAVIYRAEKVEKLNEMIHGMKDTFRNNVEDLVRNHWMIRPGFIDGTKDMIRRLPKKDSKSKNFIILSSLFSTVVGVVMTLGFFNGMATRTKINAIDNAVEPELNAIDAEIKTSKFAHTAKTEKPSSTRADELTKQDAVKDEHSKGKHTDKLAAQTTPSTMSVTR